MTEIPPFIVWPLKMGETLSNHDWFPLHGHKLLGSGFVARAVMKGQRADIGTALILWAESIRSDPAGTLPEDDLELAIAAKFGSVDEWKECKKRVLHGWVQVHVEGDDGAMTTRLGHPGMIMQIVRDMYKRKRGRDGAREAARLAVKRSRIKEKLRDLQYPKSVYENPNIIHELADYFDLSDLYITPDNVRAAMVEVVGWTGDVVGFKPRRGPK